jgi:RNA polymerase sigma-70 factor (ECF subfamily)
MVKMHTRICFQEITIQLWKAFPKFEVFTWAYRVALNTAITLYRKASAPLQLWNMKVGSILLRT